MRSGIARWTLLTFLLAGLDCGLYLRFGICAEFFRDCALVGILTALSLADLERFEIPGKLLLAGLALWILTAPLLVWGQGGAEAYRISGAQGYVRELGIYSGIHALAGILTGAAILAVSLVMDRVLGKESMGGGDIKLYALLGLYLGGFGSYLLVLGSCVIGLIAAALFRRLGAGTPPDDPDIPQGAFPFGPSIALAGYLVLLWGDAIQNWYFSLFLD